MEDNNKPRFQAIIHTSIFNECSYISGALLKFINYTEMTDS